MPGLGYDLFEEKQLEYVRNGMCSFKGLTDNSDYLYNYLR